MAYRLSCFVLPAHCLPVITTRTCTWLVPSSRFGWLHFRGQWGCRGAEEDQRWRGEKWHSPSHQSLQAVRRLRGSRPDLGGCARAGVLRAAGSEWSGQDHHLQDADRWCHGHCRQCFCQTAQHQDGHQTGGWDFSGRRYLWLELSPNTGRLYLWLELSPNVGCYLWLELPPNTGRRYLWLELSPNVSCYLWLELFPNVGCYLWLELSPNLGCYLWLELFPNVGCYLRLELFPNVGCYLWLELSPNVGCYLWLELFPNVGCYLWLELFPNVGCYLWLELFPNVGCYLWLELFPNIGCYLWLELFPKTVFLPFSLLSFGNGWTVGGSFLLFWGVFFCQLLVGVFLCVICLFPMMSKKVEWNILQTWVIDTQNSITTKNWNT